MIKQTYKTGINKFFTTTKNNYDQWYFDDELWYKGYYKPGKFINYQERYTEWNTKGIKYII